MATLLYFGKDTRVRDMTEMFFKERLADTGEVNSIMQIKESIRLEEAFVAMAFDLLLFEQNELGDNLGDYLIAFRKKYPRVNAPIIIIGEERDHVKIMRYLDMGYSDYMVMPPDRPLLIEKIVVYCTGKRDKGVRQVYSLKTSQPADLAKPATIEELSEFDCRVRTPVAVPLNDLMVIYSKSFSESGNILSTVLGRCYESMQHPEFKTQFLSSFYFVGITPDVLQNIRNALRKTYISGKPKK